MVVCLAFIPLGVLIGGQRPIVVAPPSLSKIMADARKSIVVVRAGPKRFSGGICVAPNGLIVAARHAVAGSDKIEVITYGGAVFPANVLRTAGDIVLLGTTANIPPVKLSGPESYAAGTVVYLLAHPERYNWSLHRGIISHESRDIDPINAGTIRGCLQFDAQVYQGSSGGALLNSNGELVGMAIAMRADVGGIAFAIPASELKKFIGQ